MFCLNINKQILATRNIDFEKESLLNKQQIKFAAHLDLIQSDFYANGDIISIEFARKLFKQESNVKTKRDIVTDESEKSNNIYANERSGHSPTDRTPNGN